MDGYFVVLLNNDGTFHSEVDFVDSKKVAETTVRVFNEKLKQFRPDFKGKWVAARYEFLSEVARHPRKQPFGTYLIWLPSK